MNIIYISMMMPTKGANNAGANTIYYYISNLAKENKYKIRLISKVLNQREKDNAIDNVVIYPIENGKIRFSISYFVRELSSKFNPFHCMGNTLRESIYDEIKLILDETEFIPDVIIVEYTQMLYLLNYLKKRFPKARIIASEHDVEFLWYERNIDNTKNIVRKFFRKLIYIIRKKEELEVLSKCDLILTHNIKDAELLKNNGIKEEKIESIVPYYQKKYVDRNCKKNKIFFYGAMNRPENYESAIWFIKNVFNKLEDEYEFLVVGGNPAPDLMKYQSNRIHILGFVEDLTEIFSECLCMVAPLFLGAGIKIKVLEAMASGVPTLTNDIGIEGIPAVSGRDYYNCKNAFDYVNRIKELSNYSFLCEEMSKNSIECIAANFDLEHSYVCYRELIEKITKLKNETED